MAKAKSTAPVKVHQDKPKKNYKGIHAKSKTSTNKSSKNYKKPYAGQG